MGKTKTTRFQEWYAEHGEGHNAKRRDRYANDPEYRKQKREEAKKAMAAKRKRDREGRPAKQPGLSLAEVAARLGRTPGTIRSWEAKGYIPKPTLASKTGRRYYAKQVAQIERIGRFLAQYKSYEIAKPEIAAKLGRLVASVAERW